jgi:CheY-like chemotaxis protein
MGVPMNDVNAILIAPNGALGPLRELVDRLASIGVTLSIVDELPAAVEQANLRPTPPSILLDLIDTSPGEIEDMRVAGDSIRRVTRALPMVSPIPIVRRASATHVLACIRAGAGDIIDLELEGTASARAAVQRINQRQAQRATELEMISSQRGMIEDLLKDLIKTERRTIETEEKLARQRTHGDEAPADGRAPAILLVEHDRDIADELADRLEANGVATFAYVTGEEAVREAEALASTTGLDLALVAIQLPGIDGLEAIKRLRARIPGIPAFLMTSVVDADLAATAANLGVVGFVQKPLADLGEVVARLSQLAVESLQRTREQDYVQTIKERHERVLARYRALPREP